MIESRRDKQMERKNSKHIKEVDVKKIWVFDNGKETEIPAEDKREKLIYDCRVELSHKCRTTVYYELRKKYCWPGIKDHIYQVIKGGEICQKYNRKTSRDSIFIATSRYLEKVSMKENYDSYKIEMSSLLKALCAHTAIQAEKQ